MISVVFTKGKNYRIECSVASDDHARYEALCEHLKDGLVYDALTKGARERDAVLASLLCAFQVGYKYAEKGVNIQEAEKKFREAIEKS